MSEPVDDRSRTNSASPLMPVVESVPLQSIDVGDERYRITTGAPSDELGDQLSRWGCLVPPICVKIDGGLVPVAGFKRLKCLRASDGGDRSVEVRLLGAATEPLAIVVAAVRDTRRDRELTPFECARAIRLALDNDIERSRLVELLLPELGLEPHDTVIKRHLKLEAIPATLAEFVARQGVSLRRALKLVRVTPEQAELLVAISEGLHFSLRTLEECARMLSEIARRDGKTWHQVATEAGLLEALQGSGRAPDRAKPALKSLWSLRYPTWHSAGELAVEKARAVDAPARVSLSWDQRFEKEGIEVTVEAHTIDELESSLKALLEPERFARLADLFDNL